MIITIDGPAAAGKGTLAAALAEKYKLSYFDTGMTYRAVGLEMILSGKDLHDAAAATEFARNLTFPKMMELSQHREFRSEQGGKAATAVATMPAVRDYLTRMMRDFGKNPVFADGTPAKGVIYDGRDTGTVVCPQADIKFYLKAAPEIRAERRLKDFAAKGIDISFEEVLEHVKKRDESDYQRKGTWPADDALIFDTSDLSIDEVIAKASKIIDEKQKNS